MMLDTFKEILFKKAELEGFSEYEIYYLKEDVISIETFEGELDKYSVSGSQGISFRGIFNSKMGYSSSEVLDDASIKFLTNSAKENAVVTENEEKEIIYGKKENYSIFNGYREDLSRVTPTEKIQLALDIEASAIKQSERVIRVEVMLQDVDSSCRIINSKGLNLGFRSNSIFAAVQPVVSDGDRMNSAISIKSSRAFNEINPHDLAKEAVEEALAYTGAEPVKSGEYRVALRNNTAADLLQTFSGIFSAENVQKGISLLKGKLGKQIGSKAVTIIDDPLLVEGLNSKPFDDEGVVTYTKEVICKGELKTLLYNLKTAAKAGTMSTGNASKTTYFSPVEVAPSNFYFKPGEKDFSLILKALGDGILITKLQGLHSGANPVSGDFSLAATGFVIKAGKMQRPVEQITVAGNFYKLLENVEEVGTDLRFGFLSGKGYYGSPTLIIKEMSIAGYAKNQLQMES